MDGLLNNIIPRIQQFSQSLKEREMFLDKPWAISNGEGIIMRYIFKRNHRLIITVNGNVEEGTWEFFPGFNGLILKLEEKKALFRPVFMDEKLLVLKLEGPTEEILFLANEQLLPDLDFSEHIRYLLNGKQPLATLISKDGKEYEVLNEGRDTISEGDYILFEGDPAHGEIHTKSGKVIQVENGNVEQVLFKRKLKKGTRILKALTQRQDSFQAGDIIKDSTGPIADRSIKIKGSVTLNLINGIVTDIYQPEPFHKIEYIATEDQEYEIQEVIHPVGNKNRIQKDINANTGW